MHIRMYRPDIHRNTHMQTELCSQPCEELHKHTHTRSRGLPCNDGEQLVSVNDGGCACKWRRRRKCRPIILLHCFSAEKGQNRTESNKTQTVLVTQPLLHLLTASHLPLLSTRRHSNIILSPLTVSSCFTIPALSFSNSSTVQTRLRWLGVVCTQT